MSLKQKTISGFFWSLLQNVGGKGITFVVMIILARLLTPEIFGLIGMLMIFIQVSQVLVQAGFNQALIQKKDTDEEDYSSVFWINLVVSIVIYVILFLCAPLIANFYNQQALTELTRAFSLIFIINAFSYVQEAKLTKEMRFRTLTIIHIPSVIIGGVTGIVMALLGFGVWSLIAVQIVSRFAYSVQIWFYAKWKPLLEFNRVKAKKLFSFGGKLMISGILDAAFNNIYLVVIGRFFPVSAVGYFQNARNLVRTPSSTLSNALTKVAFPAFSSIQDDNSRLKEGFKKIIQQVLFWICPAFVFAGILATPMFHFIFGDKWMPAVPYFQWLCVTGVFYPLHSYNLNVINVKGRSDIFLMLEVIKKIVIVIGLVITVPMGIKALLIFMAISTVVLYFVNSYFSGKFIGYPVFEQLKDVAWIFILSVGVGISVFMINKWLAGTSDLVRLIVGFGTGVSFYTLIASLIRLKPLIEFKDIFRNVLLKKLAK